MQYPTISEYVKAIQDAGDNLDMSTEATNAELNEAITDEFGVKYSKDGRKILEAPKELDGTYSIRKETKIICDCAFGGCYSLRSLVLPDGVTRIGDSAFDDCSSLNSLVIPDSVTSIGDGVFSGCCSLESLVIPSSVVNLKGNPFCKWDGELKSLSPYFIYDNKILFDKDKSTIISFRDKDTSSYVIPDGVTCIGDGAFGGCYSLRSLVLPDGVTRIGDSAFDDCSSLSSLVIPDSVTSIGNRAFNDCSSLSSLTIPNSITIIGDGVFRDCSSLSSLVLPNSVTSIGDGAFSGCSSLSRLVIPDSVTSIGEGAFRDCNFPDNLKQELISRFGDKIFG